MNPLRYEMAVLNGTPVIRDTEQDRVSPFFSALCARVALDAIEMGGLDPEHLSWITTPRAALEPALTLNAY